jgi:hypothetical protein
VAQAELTVKQSVNKAKEKEMRSSDIKLLESLVKELYTLDSTLNKMYQQAGPGRGHPNGKAKLQSMPRVKTVIRGSTGTAIEKIASLGMTPARKEKILQQANPTKIPRKLARSLPGRAFVDIYPPLHIGHAPRTYNLDFFHLQPY